MAQGTILIGQGEVENAPTSDKHIVRKQDLATAISLVYQNGADISALFPSVDSVARRAVYIDSLTGALKTANNSLNGGAERTIGIFFDNKVFLNGQVITNYDPGGTLERGKEYWIQPDGTLSTTAPTSGQDRWAVRIGIALTPNAMYVSYHNTGII